MPIDYGEWALRDLESVAFKLRAEGVLKLDAWFTTTTSLPNSHGYVTEKRRGGIYSCSATIKTSGPIISASVPGYSAQVYDIQGVPFNYNCIGEYRAGGYATVQIINPLDGLSHSQTQFFIKEDSIVTPITWATYCRDWLGLIAADGYPEKGRWSSGYYSGYCELGDSSWVDAYNNPFSDTFWRTDAYPWGKYYVEGLGFCRVEMPTTLVMYDCPAYTLSDPTVDFYIETSSVSTEVRSIIEDSRTSATDVLYGVEYPNGLKRTVGMDFPAMHIETTEYHKEAIVHDYLTSLRRATITDYKLNDTAIPFPEETVGDAVNYKKQDTGMLEAEGTVLCEQTVMLPYNIVFKPFSYSVGYENSVTNFTYSVSSVLEWDAITSTYKPLTFAGDKTISIVPDYAFSGGHAQYKFATAPATNYYQPISGITADVYDTFLTRTPTTFIGIRVPSLLKKLDSTSPFWGAGEVDATLDESLNVFPSVIDVTDGTVTVAGDTVTIFSDIGGSSPVVVGTYTFRDRQYTTSGDELWRVTGPNGTPLTDLPEWGTDPEGPYQFSEFSYLHFSLESPVDATLSLVIKHQGLFSKNGVATVPLNTSTYVFDVTVGANDIVIDLLQTVEGVAPVHQNKMHRVDSLTIELPHTEDTEEWVFSKTAMYLDNGGLVAATCTSRFIPTGFIVFAAFNGGKEATELWQRYGEPGWEYSYGICEPKMRNTSMLAFVNELATQAGWSADYTSPLATTENEDSSDRALTTVVLPQDVKNIAGDFKITPYVTSRNIAPIANNTIYIEGITYGGIRGVVADSITGERVTSTADAVYLYMVEYDTEDAVFDLVYTYVGSAATDAYGVYGFVDLLPTLWVSDSPTKDRRYGLSTAYAATMGVGDLERSGIRVRALEYTAVYIGGLAAPPIPPTVNYDIATAQNRYGITHTFYVADGIVYRSSSVRGVAEFEREAVIILPDFKDSLWACYHGNSLMIGGRIADGYDFILKSDDEGATWVDIPHWESLYYPSEG